MAKKETSLPDYWSIYWAVNKHRLSKSDEYTDKKTGKKMKYEFVGIDHINSSIFMHVFSGILWMSPVFLIFIISVLYLIVNPYSMFVGILFIIAYHFAAMYYIIRGPHMKIEVVKKKGLFSRK